MKTILIAFCILASLTSCLRVDVHSDTEYPIGTVVYIMPDSIKAVASGGDYGVFKKEEFLWVQYTSKFGKIETDLINKKLIYK